MSARMQEIHRRLDEIGVYGDGMHGLTFLDAILGLVKEEYEAAANKHTPFASTHEGAAVLREEFEEMWEDIKANRPKDARAEAVQVAAMAVRFIFDVGDDWSD